MKKIILPILILILATTGSFAWTLTHTYVDPKFDWDSGQTAVKPGGSCNLNPHTSPNGQDHITCCTSLAPDGSCINGTLTLDKFRTTFQRPLVNETCFRPSCYIRAANEALVHPMQVQPLTADTNVILKAVGQLTGNTTDGIQPSKVGHTDINGVPLIDTPHADVGYTIYVSLKTPPQAPPDLELNQAAGGNFDSYIYQGWEVDIGTSAMQGLLWSWRMLSNGNGNAANDWKGVWTSKSDFEPLNDNRNEIARANLPDPSHSKYIILISDGLDSDGPDNAPQGTRAYTANGETSIGFKVTRNQTAKLYETCDAHVPVASITDADYDAVCQRLAAENIKVFAILYGYDAANPSNLRLQKCATTTHGQYIPGADPSTISATLRQVFSSIATHNIRLVK